MENNALYLDSGVGTPVTLRVDERGFYLYWTDQNKIQGCHQPHRFYPVSTLKSTSQFQRDKTLNLSVPRKGIIKAVAQILHVRISRFLVGSDYFLKIFDNH
ncbi:hypothetical protein J6590_060204 [Homalodisca vitripennis]|nr:hypothetical protein J6590_060204 [Homalodisca vitripennis]